MTPAEPPRRRAGRLELSALAATLGALALAVGVIALLMPVREAKTVRTAYRQAGTFTYSGAAPAGSLYGAAGLTTGKPILTDLVDAVRFRFAYRLSSDAPVAVQGATSMVARVDLGSGLTHDIPLAGNASFTGPRGAVHGTLQLADLQRVLQAGQAHGFAGSSVSVQVLPRVAVTGAIAGAPLKATFAPALRFTYADGSLVPAGAPDATGSGAGAATGLHPARDGAVRRRVVAANTVPLPLAHPTVARARVAGLAAGGALLALAALLGWPLLRRPGDEDAPERIRLMHGSDLVGVRELSLPLGPVAEMASMAALARVAKRYESVILHLHDEAGDTYAVWDGGMLHRYRPQRAAAPAGPDPAPIRAADRREARPLPAVTVHAAAQPGLRRRIRRRLVRAQATR